MYRRIPIGLNADGKLHLELCRFSVKQPKDCTQKEINDFYNLTLKGKGLSPNGLIERIRSCELLAFCHICDILVAIGAIKRPLKSYILTIIHKTLIDRKCKELVFELGFSVTEEDYRKKGLCKMVKSVLLEEMKSRAGMIFSVTPNKTIQNYLIDYGFVKKGIPYDSINGVDTKYYEIDIKDLK